MTSPVKLLVYDLSMGMANMMSQAFLGRHIEGVWHTSIVVFEREFFFGGGGVQSCLPGEVGLPLVREVNLGETSLPYSVVRDYLTELGRSTFHGSTYNLLRHNCNNFSNELAQFLCGVTIPDYITDLPDTVLSTPLGAALLGQLERVTPNISAISGRESTPELSQAIHDARRQAAALEQKRNQLNEKIARREKKQQKRKQKEEKEKRRLRDCEKELESLGYTFRPLTSSRMGDDGENREQSPSLEVSDVSAITKKARDVVAEIAEEEAREAQEARNKPREPPVTYPDAVDVRQEFDKLVGLIDGKLSPEEQSSLEELHQYMVEGEGSWALGDSFLTFIGRLLHDKSLGSEVRVRTLNVLAAAALKDDVILVLHQDRRDHVLMNYATDVERLELDEQLALSLFFANLFEHASCSEWLMYISEWTFCNASLSNIRVTTRVAINALLSDVPALQDRATAVIHNMACKQVKTVVFDDVAVELTMAVLQYLNSSPPEELLFRVMKALARFCHMSTQEVPQLIQMIGPSPAKFLGASPRIDEQIQLIQAKLR